MYVYKPFEVCSDTLTQKDRSQKYHKWQETYATIVKGYKKEMNNKIQKKSNE